MDPEILQMAYDAIGEGCTYPVLYRDETVVRDVCRAFELPEETAVHYVPYGCGEYVIDHAGFGYAKRVINLMKGWNCFYILPGCRKNQTRNTCREKREKSV